MSVKNHVWILGRLDVTTGGNVATMFGDQLHDHPKMTLVEAFTLTNELQSAHACDVDVLHAGQAVIEAHDTGANSPIGEVVEMVINHLYDTVEEGDTIEIKESTGTPTSGKLIVYLHYVEIE